MPVLPLSPAEYITNLDALQSLVERLQNETLLAVDTESNSLYAYQEQVCLIQLSTGAADFIIDPLAIDDLTPFGELMANRNIEKVFHAAEYDITCLKRDFGFEFYNVFDTMIAARICGLELYGLGPILDTYFGIEVDKSHQLDNWGERPLDAESLAYAQMDTHFLPYLRDELHRELQRQGRLLEAQEAFSEVAQIPAAPWRVFDVDGFWKLSRPRSLSPEQLRILRELYHTREKLAQQKWLPPFKIIGNRMLVALAIDGPNSLKALRNTGLLTDEQLQAYGKAVVAAIRRGKKAKGPLKPPEPAASDPRITERYAALHSWRKQRAIRRGVESDVIISKQILWNLAERAPRSVDDLHSIDGIGPWRLQTYGQEIIDVLNRY